MGTTAASSWPEAADARDDAPALEGLEDEEEFVALYRAHFGFVWSTLRRLGVPPEALDDAAQETFMVAYRRLPDFEGRSTMRTWLFAIARRVASGHRRRVARRARGLRLLPRPTIVVDDLDEQIDRARVRDLLLAFLEQLDDDKREAFLLGELEGLSRPEMGEALGVSPNTAYSRLRAAREEFIAAFSQPEQRRALIERARERERECEPQQQRVWSAIVPVLGADTVAPGVGASTLLTQIKVFVLTVGVGVGAMTAAKATWPRPEVAPASAVAALAAPAAPNIPVRDIASLDIPATPPPEATLPVPEPAAAPLVQRPRSKPPAADRGRELALLQQARRRLEAGDATGALSSLDAHTREYATSPLAPEREVLRVEALCAAGEPSQARRHASSFASEHPGSPLLARLEVSCAGR